MLAYKVLAILRSRTTIEATMKKAQAAFTIVELAIAVVVIAILATLGAVSYNLLQQESRNGQREADMRVLSEALEKYYNEHGEYPACSDLQQSPATIASSVLPGIDPGALVSPTSPNQSASSIICDEPTAHTTNVYAYIGDGSSGCTSGGACTGWSLKYRDEGSDDLKHLNSRQGSSVADEDEETGPSPDANEPPTADITACLPGQPIPGGYTLYDGTGQASIPVPSSGNQIIKNLSSTTLISGATSAAIIVCASDSNKNMSITISGNGQKIIVTGSGNDYINVSGNSLISAGGGNDSITTSGGNSHIYGGTGVDSINTSGNNTTVYGGDGGDSIYSSGNNDVIYGGLGNDSIQASGNGVTAYGGGGADSITLTGVGSVSYPDY